MKDALWILLGGLIGAVFLVIAMALWAYLRRIYYQNEFKKGIRRMQERSSLPGTLNGASQQSMPKENKADQQIN